MVANKEYKESGVVWLGKLPAHWDVTNYRRLFCRRKEYDDNPDKQVLSLTIEGVKRKNENFGKMAEDFTGHQIVRKDDLVFTPRDFDATPILSGIAPCDGCISNLYFVLYPRTPDIDVNFYNYFMWGVKWGGDIWKKLSYGMRFSYNYDQFCALPAIKIPLSEQKAIADYLDNECVRIDNIVEKQRNIIERLKEYKKSVITEAVTKGLNPDAKMKDSDIEWIGEIPEYWEVCRIKNIICAGKDGIKIGPFGSALTGKTKDFGEYRVYSQANLVSDNFDFAKNYIEKSDLDLFQNYIIKSGDILLSMMGTIGKCKIMPENKPLGIMDSHLLKIRLAPKYIPKFFAYVYDKDSSNVVISQLLYYSKGSIMDGLNSSIVKNIQIPLAPLSEQQEIADYLDQKCAEIDSVIGKREKMIDLLTEYKKSLIYECVTGKKEVA